MPTNALTAGLCDFDKGLLARIDERIETLKSGAADAAAIERLRIEQRARRTQYASAMASVPRVSREEAWSLVEDAIVRIEGLIGLP